MPWHAITNRMYNVNAQGTSGEDSCSVLPPAAVATPLPLPSNAQGGGAAASLALAKCILDTCRP